MKQEALKLGISIENTSIVNLITQINTIKISDEADKLGISTKWKKNRGNCGRNLWNESKRGSREVRDFKKRKRDRRVSTRSVRTKSARRGKKISY